MTFRDQANIAMHGFAMTLSRLQNANVIYREKPYKRIVRKFGRNPRIRRVVEALKGRRK
jgi:hypothetical protein